MAPASNRLISSRSSTSPWNRATSLVSRSSAAWARSGSSWRRASITSTEADSVISGERSSWLTSEAKRASRSMRSCSAEAMSLNELGERAEVGVVGGGEAGAEVPAGDRLGGLRRLGERPDGAAGGEARRAARRARW